MKRSPPATTDGSRARHWRVSSEFAGGLVVIGLKDSAVGLRGAAWRRPGSKCLEQAPPAAVCRVRPSALVGAGRFAHR